VAVSDATSETIDAARSDTTSERGVARRGLVAGAIAGIAALFVGRASPAAADDGQALLLGTKNTASNETELDFIRTQASAIASPAFRARQASSMGMLGGAPVDTSRYPIGTGGMLFNQAAVAGKGDGNIGVFGDAGAMGVGLWGLSDKFIATWGASLEGIGVLGQTYPSDIAGHERPYPAAGVFGVGGRAPGTWGLSTSGPGAWGQSNTGPGVLGQTGMGAVLPAVQYPAAGVYGVGGAATGVWGVATSGIGSWGQSDSGVGVLGQSGRRASPPPDDSYPASGVLGIGNSGQPGVWGKSMGGIGTWGISDTGPGVVGQTGGAAPALGATTGYPAAGVYGIGSADKTGLWGVSDTGIGEWGQSNTGIGVLGQLGPAAAGAVYPHAGVLGIHNGESAPGPPNTPAGVWGLARGSGIGTWGQSNTGIGVSGESGNIGAWFKKGMVDIDPKTLEPAALHTTALGTDVSGCFRAEMGVAVMAEAKEGGTALMAMGRIQSDMVGFGQIPMGSDVSGINPCVLVIRGITHVDVTLQDDIGAQVLFVEVITDKGFIVHLDKRARAAGTFSYSVMDAMAHHE